MNKALSQISLEERARVQIFLLEQKMKENDHDILGDVIECDISGW